MNTNGLKSDWFSSLTKADVMAIKQRHSISKQICDARRKRNMSQKDFASFMGVTQGMVSKWENSDYNFTIDTLADIACKLSLDLNIELNSIGSDFRKIAMISAWKGCSKDLSQLERDA